MYGGEQGNRYVDTVLAPAAAAEGVTLRRVPVAATSDALPTSCIQTFLWHAGGSG